MFFYFLIVLFLLFSVLFAKIFSDIDPNITETHRVAAFRNRWNFAIAAMVQEFESFELKVWPKTRVGDVQ